MKVTIDLMEVGKWLLYIGAGAFGIIGMLAVAICWKLRKIDFRITW